MKKELFELILRAQSGSQTDLAALLKDRARSVYYLCAQLLNADDDIVTLTRRTLACIAAELNTLTQPGDFLVWSYRILAREHKKLSRELRRTARPARTIKTKSARLRLAVNR